MGYIKHDAIIVTGSEKEDAVFARAKAMELGLCVSGLTHGTTNGYTSFLIAPDGSKEGWDESDKHDAARADFIAWAKTQGKMDAIACKHSQGGMRPCWFDWAHIRFGGDDEYATVKDRGDKP